MYKKNLFLPFVLIACAPVWHIPYDFQEVIISSDKYKILTYQKLSDSISPIHIYIEGDGYAFNGAGRPTSNPTPRGTFLRDLSINDDSPNVVYMARPCQYIMSSGCDISDWTSKRFSADKIDNIAYAIKKISQNRPIILIGYSGGAMISGLVIQQNPDLNIKKWITIAGVLNHSDWTSYFGDLPLSGSLNMNKLPNIPQVHYIAENDDVVPKSLSYKWLSEKKVFIIPNATHTNMKKIKIDFRY